jgi:AraC-like DNA-binding protein
MLASAANMSRSAFAERFSRLVGLPPIEYLNRWRVGLAADRLPATSQSMVEVAQSVGYQTDRVFRRAFKQRFGVSPMQFRKQHRGSP